MQCIIILLWKYENIIKISYDGGSFTNIIKTFRSCYKYRHANKLVCGEFWATPNTEDIILIA